jgi:hypothetical protein
MWSKEKKTIKQHNFWKQKWKKGNFLNECFEINHREETMSKVNFFSCNVLTTCPTRRRPVQHLYKKQIVQNAVSFLFPILNTCHIHWENGGIQQNKNASCKIGPIFLASSWLVMLKKTKVTRQICSFNVQQHYMGGVTNCSLKTVNMFQFWGFISLEKLTKKTPFCLSFTMQQMFYGFN